MKKTFILFLFCGIALVKTMAQNTVKSTDKSILESINKEIWQPFSLAYQNLTAETYVNLHSREFIRAMGDSKGVKNLEQYAQSVYTFFDNIKNNNAKIQIGFRFTERIANEYSASERGIFELIVLKANGEKTAYYGKFHVFLRKENNHWRILVDYDSNENGSITKENYDAAFGMEEYEKF